MRQGLAVLLLAVALAAASCDLVKHRDVRRVAIEYCDADVLQRWDRRRHLLSETALRYQDRFPEYPKVPKMEYGPGRLQEFEIEKISVDWPLATVRIRGRFQVPADIPAVGVRAPVPEDGWYTLKIYLRREHDLWKVDELATKRQWITTVVGPDYAEAWVNAVTQAQP